MVMMTGVPDPWFNFLGRGRRLSLEFHSPSLRWRGFLMSVIGRSDPQVDLARGLELGLSAWCGLGLRRVVGRTDA
jgi:hypothetical protein